MKMTCNSLACEIAIAPDFTFHSGVPCDLEPGVMYETRYTGWFCGHWHQDRPLPGNIRLLWFDVCSL